MIHPNPSWTASRPQGVAAWPDRVRLIAQRVIGQWYALDRASGAVIWERDLATVNYLTGFDGNVAICATIEPGWRAGIGACALDLASGEVLWTQPLSPFRVEDDWFQCVNGSVHRLATGEKLRTDAPIEQFGPADMFFSLSWTMTRTSTSGGRVELAPGVVVSEARQSGDDGPPVLGDFCGLDVDGAVLWWFRPRAQGWWIEGARTARVVAPPFIYLIGGPDRPYRYVSNNEIEPVATAQELLVFDVRVGRIVQRVALGEQRGPVRIEAVDDSGVLVGLEETRLIYFPRVSEAQSIPR